jgi:hypothetical protein
MQCITRGKDDYGQEPEDLFHGWAKSDDGGKGNQKS